MTAPKLTVIESNLTFMVSDVGFGTLKFSQTSLDRNRSLGIVQANRDYSVEFGGRAGVLVKNISEDTNVADNRSERMEILASKMLMLAQTDEDNQLFGASSHCYLTKPCFSTNDIFKIEHEYGIRFPEEYVEFLTQIGNGGFGPYYGLYSLEESLEEAAESGRRDFLSTPFELTDRYNLYEQSDKVIHHASLVAGSIIIAHHGCGYYDRLVLSGPQSGQIWHDALGSHEEIIPLQLNFFEWYDEWLTESINNISKLNTENRSKRSFRIWRELRNWFSAPGV